jgi:hypothetical protein
MTNKHNINISFGAAPWFLIFLVLKLTEVIDWSWWWITAPLWLPFVLFGVFFAFAFLISLMAGSSK